MARAAEMTSSKGDDDDDDSYLRLRVYSTKTLSLSTPNELLKAMKTY